MGKEEDFLSGLRAAENIICYEYRLGVGNCGWLGTAPHPT